eukprot:NODE_766_length_4395_cov_0.248138.p1 type:complete len:541 gc:universal NODE_766_length_4395_cov_0.248138:2215-3837(+)
MFKIFSLIFKLRMTMLPAHAFLGIFGCVSTSKGNYPIYCKQLKSELPTTPATRKSIEFIANNLIIHQSELQQLEGSPPNNYSHFSNSFGFPKSILADLLVPTKAMCSKKFIVTLEHLTFISHPIAIDATPIHFSSREHRSGSTPSFTISEDSTDEVQPQQPPTTSLKNMSKLLEINSDVNMFDEDNDKTALHTFNIALVVDNRYLESEYFDELHEHIIEKLISIFELEQKNSIYISKQVQNLLQRHEKSHLAIEDGDMHVILDNLLDHIKGGKAYAFELRNKIFTFPNIRGFNFETQTVQPFQTILFKESRAQILKLLQEEFIKQYIGYFDHFSPFLSISETSLIHDCPLEIVIDMAQTIVSMNYAHIIDPISMYNPYCMSPACDLNRVKLYSPNFKTKYGLDLFSLLSRLKNTKPLMDHVYDMTNVTQDDPYSQIWMDAMLDMLKMDLIRQISTQVFLILSNGTTLLYNPYEATDEQMEYIDMLTNRLVPPLNEYFRKSFIYFNGMHTVTEIAYKTHIPSTELQKLFEALEKHLIICHV